MSRSTYIYTVWRDGSCLAGFTVKHEAVSWARRELVDLSRAFLWRGRDGQSWVLSLEPVAWPEDGE